jgi:hypothetical protein
MALLQEQVVINWIRADVWTDMYTAYGQIGIVRVYSAGVPLETSSSFLLGLYYTYIDFLDEKPMAACLQPVL